MRKEGFNITKKGVRKTLKATPFEIDLARVMNKTPYMIRYYTARLLLEMYKGETLTVEESDKLGHIITQTFRQNQRVKIKFPWLKRAPAVNLSFKDSALFRKRN